MSYSALEDLEKNLKKLAPQIQEIYEETTKTAIDVYADEMEEYFRRNSGSATLNKQMRGSKIDQAHKYYERNVDWDDTKIVNIEQGKGVGRDRNKKRERGKRNFSLHPATYHDLAYIINFGHGGKSGNHFITKGIRRAKKWADYRDILFKKKLNKIGEDFE